MANWDQFSRQGNVLDRRGIKSGGLGVMGIVAVVGISMLFGADPMQILGQLEQQGALATPSTENTEEFAGMDEYEKFSSVVLGSLDAYWEKHVPNYTPATLVLFRDRTSSSCGGAYNASGPHYCPQDATIYLDERFFDELQTSFGAKGGDVAEAYVIAHEVGHHVQAVMNLLETGESLESSVNTELTADCFAGAWLASINTENVYEENEITEALDAASAVGDDNIQQRTQGTVQPESWTHGSSAARKESVMLGYANPENPSICVQ